MQHVHCCGHRSQGTVLRCNMQHCMETLGKPTHRRAGVGCCSQVAMGHACKRLVTTHACRVSGLWPVGLLNANHITTFISRLACDVAHMGSCHFCRSRQRTPLLTKPGRPLQVHLVLLPPPNGTCDVAMWVRTSPVPSGALLLLVISDRSALAACCSA